MIKTSDMKVNRKLLGLSQVEVSNKVGVSMQTYALWERGAMKPNEINEKKLREVLKMGE